MKIEINGVLKGYTKKYMYLLIFAIILITIISVIGYLIEASTYVLILNDELINLKHGIYSDKDTQYIHIDDLTTVFSDNIYYDKISGKILITNYDNMKSIDKNDTKYCIIKDNNLYINISSIMLELDNEIYIQKKNIYVVTYDSIEASITKNRVEIYDKFQKRVLAFANKQDEVKVYVNDTLLNEKSEMIDVVAKIKDVYYYGYVLKANIQFDYTKNEDNSLNKVIMVNATNYIKEETDKKIITDVRIDMLRLSGIDIITTLDYTIPNEKNFNVYATISNGQNLSNYDSDVVSNMLNSSINREKVIEQLLVFVINNDITGICINFSNFKNTDKGTYIQFIKELSAKLHSNNKKVIVKLPNIDYLEIEKYVDYIIVEVYNEKTINSKTSGPISSIRYISSILDNLNKKEVNKDKYIIELPAYSILWTERNGTVINTEIYSMKLIEEYINANKIEIKKDSNTNEKYINYTKGITTYKMWIEDIDSIANKCELIESYGFRNISIERSGFEQIQIYKRISEIFSK